MKRMHVSHWTTHEKTSVFIVAHQTNGIKSAYVILPRRCIPKTGVHLEEAPALPSKMSGRVPYRDSRDPSFLFPFWFDELSRQPVLG